MKTQFEGITYKQVKSVVQEVADQIPEMDIVCDEYTVSNCSDPRFEKTILKADVGHIKIELLVTYDNEAYVPVVPIEGEWRNIEKLLRQVTKDYGEDYYQMLLDYLAITYNEPFQSLPILVLSSKERGVGKTTFLNLLKAMYNNRCVIGGWRLIYGLNSSIANKLIIGVDESDINDMALDGAKLICMAKSMDWERKGKDTVRIPFFGKIVICTNANIPIAEGETRFWNIHLSPWNDSECDFDIDDKISAEVPAFLHYLRQRWENGEMLVKEREFIRWFHPKRYIK